jgi:hypothetical protein
MRVALNDESNMACTINALLLAISNCLRLQ